MTDKVEIYTDDGCYSIPQDELDKWKVDSPSEPDTSEVEDDDDVEGFVRNFDFNTLRPNHRASFRMGKRPVVRHRGRIVMSMETIVTGSDPV